ncbi:starch-binding domain-containing protein 1 [Heliangelus exortis]|uniref:starch-binding domain-containing protein 1 n=1 Tax=Heliangelus exortis TaxID=472823 RepID=UPI003A951151
MARDRGPPVLPAPAAAFPAAFPAEARGWGWLGAGLWPALVVGLLAALLAWFWYGGGDEEGGGGSPRGTPRDAGQAAAADLLGSGEQVRAEGKAGALRGSGQSGEDGVAARREELNHVPSGGVSGEALKRESGCRERPAARHGGQASKRRPQTGEASDGWCVMDLAGAFGDVGKDRSEKQPGQPAESRDLEHEEWEVISDQLAWGEAGKNGSVEDSESKELEQGDCPDGDSKAKRVAAVPPMFQNIHVTFRVHYITHSESHQIGITGDHECLGQWHSYVPLKYDKDGFWSGSIALPVDTRVEWKFILVENGKVRRWEECGNRTLVTEHEDQTVHRWWGHH